MFPDFFCGPFCESAAANLIGTVFGGLFLTALYFAFGEKLLRVPDLNGLWVMDEVVQQTKYNPYRGMFLRYKVLLIQDRTSIRGTAEKILERGTEERAYTGTGRPRLEIEGTISKRYLGRSRVVLHLKQHGELRFSSAFSRLKCKGFGKRLALVGEFASTAADSYGKVTFQRVPLDYTTNEYRGLPIRWFGRAFGRLTSHLYEEQWAAIKPALSLLGERAHRVWKIDNLHLPIAALILAEDRRFFSHSGLDPIGIARALWRGLSCGELQGASTIEQQLIRVITKDRRRSVRRKFKEMVLGCRVESVIPKRMIPVAYLLCAYMGWRMNGIYEAAARLNINLRDPSLADSAALVSRIRFPEPQHANKGRADRIAGRATYIRKLLQNRPYLMV